MVELIEQALTGETAHARKIHFELLPLFRAVFLDTNPIPIKYMMHRAGYCAERYRLPMVGPSAEHKQAIDALMVRYGLT